MSQTYTFTATGTKEVGSRLMADLRLMRAFYGRPDEPNIARYGKEVEILLEGGYLERVEYGFRKTDGSRVVSVEYRARYDGGLDRSDTAGNIFARADLTAAYWFSYMWYSWRWSSATPAVREGLRRRLPFERSEGAEPTDGSGGYWVEDKTYGAQGIGVVRRQFRPR
jgi:hypothetical protein